MTVVTGVTLETVLTVVTVVTVVTLVTVVTVVTIVTVVTVVTNKLFSQKKTFFLQKKFQQKKITKNTFFHKKIKM